MLDSKTLLRPLGGEVYEEIVARNGDRITLTYNDLWMLLVCRVSHGGDWMQTRKAADQMVDGLRKRALAEHLWELEHVLGGLPDIPKAVQNLHIHRANQWFHQRPVCCDRNW
jgi:hypothetical protein